MPEEREKKCSEKQENWLYNYIIDTVQERDR